jgi:hypothetical protein
MDIPVNERTYMGAWGLHLFYIGESTRGIGRLSMNFVKIE